MIDTGKMIAARYDRGFTQTDLAGLIGVTYSAVSRWECGMDAPSISKFCRWCDALGLEPGDVLI